MNNYFMLHFYFVSLLAGIIVLLFTPSHRTNFIKWFTTALTGALFLYSLQLLLSFDATYYDFQSIAHTSYGFELMNVQFTFGLDGISIFFFILTTMLTFFCVVFVLDEPLLKYYLINILLIELLLLLVFSVLDLFLFYIFFESILIPMYLIIGTLGSRDRKVWAAYLLFFYTLCGSLLLLLGIIYISLNTGTNDISVILKHNFSPKEQYFLWLAFFLSFASKIPMFPLHIWLPEAHVEAPTAGSVILAGVLLKLGVYGFLRFSLAMFPAASAAFAPLVYVLGGAGVIYGSFAAIRQTDMKRIIAYSSVAHMNLIVVGLFSLNALSLDGSMLQSISHGFVSSALFFMIGIIYKRYKTRTILYYGGLTQIMPIFAAMLLFFTLANIALPGTSSFVGETLVLLGIFKVNARLGLLLATSVVLGGTYSLWLCNRINFGNIKISRGRDLTAQEFLVIAPLALLVLVMGIFPNIWLDYFSSSLKLLAVMKHFCY